MEAVLDFPIRIYCRGCDRPQPMVFRPLVRRVPALGIQVHCASCKRIAMLIDARGRTLCPRCDESVRAVAEVSAQGAYAWVACPACMHTLVTLYGVSLDVCARLGVVPELRNG